MRFSARGDEAETSAIIRGVTMNYLATGKTGKQKEKTGRETKRMRGKKQPAKQVLGFRCKHGGASSGARAQYSACTGELVPLLTSSVSRQTG